MSLIDVLEEHAEEAAFLWMMRQGALPSWDWQVFDSFTAVTGEDRRLFRLNHH